MKQILYVFGKKSILKIVTQILSDYKIVPLTHVELNNENFKNNNTIFFLDRDLEKKIKKYFFLQNNTMIFISDNKSPTNKLEPMNMGFFYGRIRVKKFVDEIKTYFITKKTILNKIEISGDKITNMTLGLSLMLTPLEKEILIFLFENKRIKKDYLLEKIIKIKKGIETKTAESHLTRIRGKLMKINSEIHIKTKEDVFYLDY